jgi:hypothetical protein
MLFVVTLWQKNGRKVNTYLDRQAVSLKIDTMVSTHWYPIIIVRFLLEEPTKLLLVSPAQPRNLIHSRDFFFGLISYTHDDLGGSLISGT